MLAGFTPSTSPNASFKPHRRVIDEILQDFSPAASLWSLHLAFWGKKVCVKVIYALNRLQLLLLAACEMENQLSFLGFIADFIYGVHLDGILILERAA